MEEWKYIKACDYCYNVTDGTHDSPKQKETGKYLITSKHIKGNRIDFDNAYKISEDDYKKIISRSKVDQWDIIISMIGAYCGFCCIESSTQTDYAIKNVGLFKIGDELKCKWLYYYLTSPLGKQQLSILRSGSSQPYISLNALRNLEIPNPNKEVMIPIVSILQSIDSKIELNRRINDNLEQQAQALFKSWFVDTPNPDWEETTLSEVASFIGGYSYKGDELADSSDIAMATIKNFGRNGGFKVDGFKDITPSTKLKECQYVDMFDVLVAHTDLTQNADVIGNAELLLTYGKYDRVIFSMDLVKVLPKNNFPYKFLLAAMLKNKIFKGHCLGYVNGTTVLHLNKKALPEFEIRIPSEYEARTMNDTLTPYFEQMAGVLQENERLIRLRDTLLPKLMSGELKISDIETAYE